MSILREPMLVGTNIQLGQNKITFQTARMLTSSGKFNTARIEFYWDRLEGSDLNIKIPPNLSDAVSYVSWLKRSGGTPLVVLGYGNASLGIEHPRNDFQRRAFARYAGFLSSKLRDSVDLYELWNEWNIGGGKKDGVDRHGDAADYVKLAAATKVAITMGNPAAKLICGSLADLDLKWLHTVVKGGLLDHCDGISLHPYVFGYGKAGTPERLFAWVDDARLVVERASGGPAVIYLTETGWPVSTNVEGVSEQKAANFLAKTIALAWSRPWIRGVWIYELQDSGHDAANREHRFGLVQQDGKARQTFNAVADIAGLATNTTVGRYDQIGGVSRIAMEKKNSGCAMILWSFLHNPDLGISSSRVCKTRSIAGIDLPNSSQTMENSPVIVDVDSTCSLALEICNPNRQ